jgi:hypothetical protein
MEHRGNYSTLNDMIEQYDSIDGTHVKLTGIFFRCIDAMLSTKSLTYSMSCMGMASVAFQYFPAPRELILLPLIDQLRVTAPAQERSISFMSLMGHFL